MANLGDLIIRVGGDPAGFKAAMTDASIVSDRFSAKIVESVSRGTVIFDAYGAAVESSAEKATKAAAEAEKAAKRGEELAARIAQQTEAAAGRVVQSLGGVAAATQEGEKGVRSFVGAIPGMGVAAERFIGLIPGLGQAIIAAFPVLGLIAFTEGLVRIYHAVSEAVSNFFAMKEAMQEVEQVGREMAKSAEAAIEHINQLQIASLREQGKLVAAAVKEMQGLVDKPIQLPSLDAPERKKKLGSLNGDEIPKLSAVFSEVLPADIPARIQKVNEGIARTSYELDQIAKSGFDPLFLNTRYAKQSQAALDLYGDALQFLQIKQQEFAAEAGKASADIGKAQVDEQKKREEVGRAASEVLRRRASEQKQSDELELAEIKAHGTVTVGQTIKFWQDKLAADNEGAIRAREIQVTLGNLYQEQDRVIQRVADHGKAVQEKQAKEAEKQKAFLSQMVLESEALALKIGADIAKRNAELEVLKAEAGSEAAQNALAMERLGIERDYALQIAKTAQSQIAYAQQIAALDAKELQAKIALLQARRAIETDAVKAAKLDNQIAAAKNQATEREYSTLTRIRQLQQQNTALGRVQIGLWNTFNGTFQKLSSGIASAIVNAKNFGSAMLDIVKSIGQEILQTLIGAALGGLQKALAQQVASWLGLKAVQSAADTAQVIGSAGVGGAAAAAAAAPFFWWQPELAVAVGAAMAGSIGGTFGPLAAFEKGGLVPETMLALVHKGEWVTPAAQVAQGISGPRSGAGGGNIVMNFHGVTTARDISREVMKVIKTAGGPRFSPAS